MIGVSDPAIKWPIAIGFLLIGLLCGLVYYGCLSKNQAVSRAFENLANSFETDVTNLLKNPVDIK